MILIMFEEILWILLWLILGAQSAALSTCQGNYIVLLGKIPTLVSALSTLECEWLLTNC